MEQISTLKPDALGFVLWPKSKRFVEPELVGTWATSPTIKRVGVFVNPSEADLLHACTAARLDVVQVHRVATNWQVDRARFAGVEFWNALTPGEDCFSLASGFLFDRELLDSYDPQTVGGTGRTCDWSLAAELVRKATHPVLLAGGLTPENVSEAIRLVRPWGVDVSSGVEIEPGRKDIEKVKQFIGQCR